MRLLTVFLVAVVCCAQRVKFEGRTVTVTAAEIEDELFPKGPASVCIEGPPRRQCYTAPKEYGRAPEVELVRLDRRKTALLFSADSGGVSGWSIHYAILRPGEGDKLEDILPWSAATSNQSQRGLWNLPEISEARVFVTADAEWGPGPDETHYSPHRYKVSAYVLFSSELLDDDLYYYLDDQYLTVRKYDLESDDVLAAEKAEINARLKRVKAERDKSRPKK
jgi:hypothetical protein